LLRQLIGTCVRNPVLANLAAAALVVGGAVAAARLPRETFPEISVDHVTISVAYPGAGPEDVEQAVCVKIEQAIEGVPGIWEVGSISSEGEGVVVAAFDPSISPAAEVIRQVQDRVNIITTFPREAERPIVVENVVRNLVAQIGVYGDAPQRAIQRIAEDVRNDLLSNPQVSQISLSGVRDYEISIQLKEDTLQQYGLTLQQVIDIVSHSSLDLPAGTVRTRHEEISVRTLGQRRAAHEFEDLPVIARPDGTSVRLGQIAQVTDAFETAPVYGRINGSPGVRINVAKTSTEDLSRIAKIVRSYVQEGQRDLPNGVHLSVLADKSLDVDARMDMLLANGVQGLVLVLLCLILFMDLRSATGVALGIPVSYAGSLAVMGLMGVSLNMISMLGLLLTSGIIVDDSIVVADAIRSRSLAGLAPEVAATEGTMCVAMPVLNASLTMVIMFLPLMFVEGVMGKLMFGLPVVVIASIVASAVEVFGILPAHLCEWTERAGIQPTSAWRVNVRRRMDGVVQFVITRLYRPLLRQSLRGRLIVLGGWLAMLLLAAGLVWGGRTPFVLFPKLDVNTLRVRVRFPDGTPAEVGLAAVERIERAGLSLNDDPELTPAAPGALVRQVVSTVGEWTDFLTRRGSSLCETTIELMPAEDRRIDCAQIIERWRLAIGSIPDAVSVSISREELGPTEKPIEVRLLGEDLDELRGAADALTARLSQFDGVFDVEDNLIPGKRELHVALRPTARNLGLTEGDLGTQLRQGLYGGEAVSLQRGRDEVKVVVSYVESDRRSLSAIDTLRIRTPTGDAVPFHEVAVTKMVRGYSSIGRQDGQRRVRVWADVDERHANAERIVQELEASFLPSLKMSHPGVSYLIDGQRKRIEESVGSLFSAAGVALAVVFAVLGATLRSYVQPLIIMTAIPLGMVGCVVGHAIMGYELTLMSLCGMVALAGIVVNDSIVLVDRVNQNLAEGMGVYEAVAGAGETRFLAVFLTAVTDLVGLMPLLTERSSQAQSLIPMAISIAFGLCFAAALTLLVVPALYLLVNDAKRFAHWLRYGGAYPLRERVERAAHARFATV